MQKIAIRLPGTDTGCNESYPSTAYASYVVVLLFVAFTVSSVDRQILTLMVEPVRADFDLTDFEISLLQGFAFSLLFTLVGLPVSRLADSKSRRSIIAAGISFWCVMTALCGYASSFRHLFLARMGVGVGEATLLPAATSLISDYFPPTRRGLALSIFYLGYPVGGGLALVIGATVLDTLAGMETVKLSFFGEFKPWQATFLIVGLPGLLVAALMYTVREPRRIGLLTTAAGEGSQQVSLAEVYNYLCAHKNAYLAQISAVSLLSILSFGTAMWYPTFLIRTYDISASEAGYAYGSLIIVFGTLGLLFGGWLSKALAERGYKDANMRVMLIAVVAKSVPMTIAPLMPSLELALLFLAPSTFFSSMVPGVSIAALQDITPNQIRGQIVALKLLFVNILGIGFGGMLVAAVTDFVFQDDNALRYSLVLVCAVILPVIILILARGLPWFRQSLDQAGSWQGKMSDFQKN